MIRIENIKTYKPNDNDKTFRVDRFSKILGNKFYMHNESERDYVCDKYEAWLFSQIKMGNSEVIKELREIYNYIILNPGKNIVLLCWCAPKRCHAESIVKVLNSWLTVK